MEEAQQNQPRAGIEEEITARFIPVPVTIDRHGPVPTREDGELDTVTPYSTPGGPVPLRPLFKIGRDRALCYLPMEDPDAANEHALVIHDPHANRWAVADLGSLQGTKVNGARIEQLTWLRDGDRIRFGKMAEYRLEGAGSGGVVANVTRAFSRKGSGTSTGLLSHRHRTLGLVASLLVLAGLLFAVGFGIRALVRGLSGDEAPTTEAIAAAPVPPSNSAKPSGLSIVAPESQNENTGWATLGRSEETTVPTAPEPKHAEIDDILAALPANPAAASAESQIPKKAPKGPAEISDTPSPKAALPNPNDPIWDEGFVLMDPEAGPVGERAPREIREIMDPFETRSNAEQAEATPTPKPEVKKAIQIEASSNNAQPAIGFDPFKKTDPQPE